MNVDKESDHVVYWSESFKKIRQSLSAQEICHEMIGFTCNPTYLKPETTYSKLGTANSLAIKSLAWDTSNWSAKKDYDISSFDRLIPVPNRKRSEWPKYRKHLLLCFWKITISRVNLHEWEKRCLAVTSCREDFLPVLLKYDFWASCQTITANIQIMYCEFSLCTLNYRVKQ
jgi:hypothetical protein